MKRKLGKCNRATRNLKAKIKSSHLEDLYFDVHGHKRRLQVMCGQSYLLIGATLSYHVLQSEVFTSIWSLRRRGRRIRLGSCRRRASAAPRRVLLHGGPEAESDSAAGTRVGCPARVQRPVLAQAGRRREFQRALLAPANEQFRKERFPPK